MVVVAITVPIYRSRASVHTRVVTVTPSAPARYECVIGFSGCSAAAVRATSVAAVQRRFPGATAVNSYGLSNNGRLETEFLQVRTSAAVLVSVHSRCGGGAGAVPDRHYGSTGSTGPAHEVFVIGGPEGCSVAVTIVVPAGVGVPAGAARALAHDAVLMVGP
jgi:hypothetical protein